MTHWGACQPAGCPRTGLVELFSNYHHLNSSKTSIVPTCTCMYKYHTNVNTNTIHNVELTLLIQTQTQIHCIAPILKWEVQLRQACWSHHLQAMLSSATAWLQIRRRYLSKACLAHICINPESRKGKINKNKQINKRIDQQKLTVTCL